MQYTCIQKEEWDKALEQLLLSYTIFANIENEFGLDYELIRPGDIPKISYNKPKPATSLKSFFLPVRENVTADPLHEKPRIIIGIPNCDIEGILLLDEIYLDNDFDDTIYRRRRKNTILISSDCLSINEHCHCLSYGIKPYSSGNADISVLNINGIIVLGIISARGREFINGLFAGITSADNDIISEIERAHATTEELLVAKNTGLPGLRETGRLINESGSDIWERYSTHCVSCGACITVCPTCSCFLLIDKPGFEKIKQMDGCQYPGFERVAGGEDPLGELHNRFRNRYMCKYIWRPRKFSSTACSGCGRCIEACIGHINKNEIFLDLVKHSVDAG